MITMTRRFYMAYKNIKQDGPPLKLYSEAIDEAKQFLKENPNCDERFIVEIVAVVKRESTPLIVEEIRTFRNE